eukprot:TRINITY_DN763_c0_g1_i1.p1 TRINITY_DN763_c0_g1~~TRINITY_DN763_c0_g1_i1.p1  ORF type:complete len:398 (-),score=168.21 TRINITY_DN763_c0_g1_i1:44-1237(-)
MLGAVVKQTFKKVARKDQVLIFTRSYAAKKNEQPAGSVKIEFKSQYKTHKLDAPPMFTYTTREELLGFYREMSLIRKMEVAANTLYTGKDRLIRGFLHLYNGQEAVASGLESALTPQDHVITAYRDHGFLVTRRCGGTAKEVLAELAGRFTGCSKGKGGSMHMYKRETNFYGGNGIVGAQVPLGTGIAFAQKYNKTGQVTVSYFGDGAANQGQVYESFNMAQLWKLPVIYVVENNLYAMGTSIERASATKEFYTRGDYVPGLQFDGMDVLVSREVGKYAKEYALTKGPIFLEAKTYRFQGHSMSDPGTTYRTREEVQQMRDMHDPILKVQQYLLDNKLATDEELKKISDELKAEVDEAVKFARESPEPAAEELYHDVYTEPTFIRGTELANSYYPKK